MIEAFARIANKKPVIADGCFRSYLYTTGRHLASRWHTGFLRRAEFSLDEMEKEPESKELLEQLVWKDDRRSILHLCMERIDAQLREALWLIYFEDMSYAEAAGIMGCKERRIEYLLTKGKAVLRKELGKEGINDAYD